MARPANGDALNIAQLEQMLGTRRRRLTELQKEYVKAEKKLNELGRRISQVNGGGGMTLRGGGGKRPQNAMSLVAALESVLKGNSPLGVGDIVEKVQAAGYRSSSANFRSLVNQTLIKDKRFASSSRGMYQMKK